MMVWILNVNNNAITTTLITLEAKYKNGSDDISKVVMIMIAMIGY